MQGSYGDAADQSGSKSQKGDASYGKSFRNSMGSMAGGAASGLTNAVVTGGAARAGGFQAAGPAGAGAGRASGANAATSSWVDFRNAKRAERAAAADGGSSRTGSSTGAGSGGGSSIQQVKQTANAIAGRIAEGDGALAAAMDKLSSAATLIDTATQDSKSTTVEQLKANMARSLEGAGEAMNVATPARQAITEWVGKI